MPDLAPLITSLDALTAAIERLAERGVTGIPGSGRRVKALGLRLQLA